MSILTKKLWGSVKEVVIAFNNDRCFERAAALAYASLLTIVPLFTLLLLIVTMLPIMQSLGNLIEDFLFNNLLPSSNQVIHAYTKTFALQATKLSWISVIFLVITAILLLHSIETAFNDIWKTTIKKNNYWHSLLRYSIFSIFTPLVLGGLLIFNAYIFTLFHIRQDVTYHDPLRNIMQLFSGFLIYILIFSFYKFLPRAKIPISAAALGALFTTVVFLTGKILFKLYLDFFSGYKALYGAFAALPIFLLWLYITWLIVLLGFEIMRHIYDRP
ncbi:MAG: YihY family inner membrane protein [Gammaproteobacteria bacterium]|nr:YihY family inner membrane protein [Gammaproteobacteria bacterium]